MLLYLDASTMYPVAIVQQGDREHYILREVESFSKSVDEFEFNFPDHVTCELHGNDVRSAFLKTPLEDALLAFAGFKMGEQKAFSIQA